MVAREIQIAPMDSIELAKFSWLLEEEQKRGAPQYKFKELLIDIIID